MMPDILDKREIAPQQKKKQKVRIIDEYIVGHFRQGLEASLNEGFIPRWDSFRIIPPTKPTENSVKHYFIVMIKEGGG